MTEIDNKKVWQTSIKLSWLESDSDDGNDHECDPDEYFYRQLVQHWILICQIMEAVVCTSYEKKAPPYMERLQKGAQKNI